MSDDKKVDVLLDAEHEALRSLFKAAFYPISDFAAREAADCIVQRAPAMLDKIEALDGELRVLRNGWETARDHLLHEIQIARDDAERSKERCGVWERALMRAADDKARLDLEKKRIEKSHDENVNCLSRVCRALPGFGGVDIEAHARAWVGRALAADDERDGLLQLLRNLYQGMGNDLQVAKVDERIANIAEARKKVAP